MSLTLALGSAFTGLKANQSQFAYLSRNIENAGVGHYVRKDVVLSSRIVAGINLGLDVGVVRDVDERLVRDVRTHSGSNSALSTKVEYLKDWSSAIGQPQDESSIASTLSNFKIALQSLEGSAGSQVDQLNALRGAEALTSHLGNLHGQAKSLVGDADNQIRQKVNQVNEDLVRLETLNKAIGNSSDAANRADLMDQRDLIADRISKEIGITTYVRENGEMVVLARGGATLLDGSAVSLEYSPMGGLETSDGVVLTPGNGNPSGIKSGSIAGLYEIRDEVMPEFMAHLDNLASGIIRMFETTDTTLNPGDAGLFTDAGAAYDPANIEGLASRIRVNNAVRPASGGELWRISSGINAAAPLPGADSTQVAGFLTGFETGLSFQTLEGVPANAKIEDFAVSMVSTQQAERVSAQSSLTISTTTLSTLQETRMNRDGVNVDDELMKMQLVEQSYQASSAVLTSVQTMLDTLLAAV